MGADVIRLALFLACLFSFSASALASTRLMPLYPVGAEGGVLVYASEPFAAEETAHKEFLPERVRLKNWSLDWSLPHADGSRVECRVRYTGPVALSLAQLHACKPVVLALPYRQDGYQPPERPNLVMLMIDTLRGDHTPPYGHPFVIAPHIDLLASLGVTFETAYSASPSTRPSVGTIFSGLHPIAHGAERHALRGAALRPAAPHLAEWLDDLGYASAAAISNAQITAAYGFDRGFERYHCPVADHQVTELGLDELERLPEPFFLYLHYIAPHQPYEPAGLYRGLYEGLSDYEEQDAYCAEITHDDRRLGRIVADLARRGLLDRTVIWTISDHGEEFWEHGWNGHGAKLYEESVRTASIVTAPHTIGMGERVSEPVMHADVFPTLQEWLGNAVEFPQAGLSLMPLLRSEELPEAFQNRSIFLHHGGGLEDAPHESDKQALVSNEHKLIWHVEKTNEFEWYSLADDPLEQQNLAGQGPPTMTELKPVLQFYINAQHLLAERLITPGAGGGVRLSRQELENLRDLGYVK